MIYRPTGQDPHDPRLGRFIPDDDDHIRKYPISALGASTIGVVERKLVLPRWHLGHDQVRQGSCFPAGTLIRMADGSHKPIENVKTLDEVLTAEGNSRTVLGTMVRMAGPTILRLNTWGHSHLRMTPEHPVLTKRGYVPAAELNPGDYVRIPRFAPDRNQELSTDKWIGEQELVTKTGSREWNSPRGRGKVVVKTVPIPKKITLTNGFGRIVGLWLAEGSTSKQKVIWSLGGHERDTLAAELMDLLTIELGVKPTLAVRGNGSLTISVYGTDWSKLFTRMMSLGPYDKCLPAELSSGPVDFLSGVIEGWLAGDGHRRRGRDSGVTVSHRLGMDMFAIGAALGKRPAIRRSEPKPNAHAATRRPRWDIELANEDSYRATQDDDALWRRVRGVEEQDFAGYVYNIHVDDDESYVAEGIGVHNCVGHGAAFERSVTNTAQNKLARLFRPTRRYDPLHIWNEAKRIDQWSQTNPGDNEGTSVRAAYDVLREQGARVVRSNGIFVDEYSGQPLVKDQRFKPSVDEGILTNRWAATTDEIRTAIDSGNAVTIGVNWYAGFDNPIRRGREWFIEDLGRMRGGHSVCIVGASDKRQAFLVKNSWGRSYPLVWLPYEMMQKLLDQDGEATLQTDR